MSASTFNIYNASAGSGKTFTLVKDYLKIVLTSKEFLPHRHVLAITFTNKAVDEMKTRILEALMAFKRAGADGVLTYFALEVAASLRNKS